MSGPRTVRVQVRFRESIPAHAGTVRVVLEDVSRADAAAPVVAETSVPLTTDLPAGGLLPVDLTAPTVNERARYNIRVHVQVDGNDAVTLGDRISTQSCPVLTFGAGDHAEIEVITVR